MIHEVPWAIPIQEIKDALERQGINPVSLTRIRGNVRVEVIYSLSERLLHFQLLFYLYQEIF